jgi:signal transduction histidine kinase
LRNTYDQIFLTNKFTRNLSELPSTSASLTYSKNSYMGALYSFSQDQHTSLTSTPFQQGNNELALLNAKKSELEKECDRLNQEILNKEETLNQLQKLIDSAAGNYQASSASQLAAGLAHEIRNPLTTIKGFIQLLQPDLQSTGKQELADVALDEINRANGLLSEFLSVLKPGFSGKRKLPFNSLVKSMLKLISSQALLKDIELRLSVPEKVLFVLAEENQIKQVLINLMKNALEAVEGNVKKRGVITVAVQEQSGYTEISVTDNGVGIDEFSMKKMFTPFYTTKETGTGIGLVICKQIIEDHGGSISVDSECGTTRFFFTLPVI